MKYNKLTWPTRLLITFGLLLGVLPQLFNEYIKIPDTLRGFMIGAGIGLEFVGLIRATRERKAGASPCNAKLEEGAKS